MMGLLNNFDISGSAMHAQTVRLNLTASNLANAQSVSSSVEETYRARHPVFSTILNNFKDKEGMSSELNNGMYHAAGVRVLGVVESDAPVRLEYRPNHPLANDEGYIAMPNVNVVEEMANMISASRSYQSNVEVVNTSKQLLMRTLSLGK